jgi:hypothetical protein
MRSFSYEPSIIDAGNDSKGSMPAEHDICQRMIGLQPAWGWYRVGIGQDIPESDGAYLSGARRGCFGKHQCRQRQIKRRLVFLDL